MDQQAFMAWRDKTVSLLKEFFPEVEINYTSTEGNNDGPYFVVRLSSTSFLEKAEKASQTLREMGITVPNPETEENEYFKYLGVLRLFWNPKIIS